MYDKTVLITGAAKRIGAALVRYLHAEGMNVLVHYHNSAEEAHRLVRELNNKRHDSAITIHGDLRYKEYYQPIIDTAVQFKGGLDVLINNASAFFPTPIPMLADDDWHALIDTNLKAPLFLSKLAAPALCKGQGCIINICDIHAIRPLSQHTIYSISKTGLLALTRSLAKELSPSIRVNAISPGAILWPENEETYIKQEVVQHIPMQRAGKPEDIAKTVMFLIRYADYITGQIINVDGGRSLHS